MPDQRKKGKRCVSVWLNESQMSILDDMIENGLVKNKSDFVKKALTNFAKEKGMIDENDK